MADDQAEEIRSIERTRLEALVGVDMLQAEQLHADDFQLVNPAGRTYTKAEYLGDVASGVINYRAREPGEIAVLQNDDMAVVRYQAQMELTLDGRELPPSRLWHTDVYERRDARWQVVWSQATRIQQ